MIPELAALIDKQSITEVIYRYCRAIDRLDEALLQSCFHDDSQHVQGAYEGPTLTFCRYAIDKLADVECTHHQVGNVLIELAGDVAHAESYWTAYHRLRPDGPPSGLFRGRGIEEELLIGGRYIDRFERRDSGWRIAGRFGVYDWQHYAPASEGDFRQLAPERRGQRGRGDRAYWRG
jgi:hypothetical protein